MNGPLDEWTQKPSSVFICSGGLEYLIIIIIIFFMYTIVFLLNDVECSCEYSHI